MTKENTGGAMPSDTTPPNAHRTHGTGDNINCITGGSMNTINVRDLAIQSWREDNAKLRALAEELAGALAETTDDLEAAYDDGQGARPTAVSATIHRARAALARAKEGSGT